MQEVIRVDRDERRQRAATLDAGGLSHAEIGAHLGVSASTVKRDLAATYAAAERPRYTDDSAIVTYGNRLAITERGNALMKRSASRSRHSRRVTLEGTTPYLSTAPIIAPPPDYENNWRLMALDRNALDALSPAELMTHLINLSPSLARAVWDFIQLCDPGHEIRVLKPGTEEIHEQGQAVLDDFLTVLEGYYGSFKVITARLFMSAYIRGAFFCELVMGPDGRTPVDLVTPDPLSVRFRKEPDEFRGEVWVPGQWQGGTWTPFDGELVQYIPVHPMPGEAPYGRAPAGPALYPSLFLLGLFHDLRRVVSMQGYLRLDISLSFEKLAAAFPADFDAGGEQWLARIDEALDTIEEAYKDVLPEDAYIHTDDASVNRPVGSLEGNSIASADTLIKALERSSVQALKTMPLTMGITDGVSEANANRQWEINAAGIKSFQQLCETLLDGRFQLVLEAQGIDGIVEVKFAEVRAAELERDEKWARQRMENAAYAEDRGWMTALEAAIYGLAGEPADAVVAVLEAIEYEQPAPPPQLTPGDADEGPDETDDTVIEPGADR